ncbi:hypothetical protein ALC62_08528, partial [Cyphomyrmex costatus]
CPVVSSHASRKTATKRSKSTCIIYRWGCLYGKWCVYTDEILESMLTVPTDATTTGACVGKIANITLSWEPVKYQGYNNKKNKITFNYSHDNSKFFLDSIFVDLHALFPQRRFRIPVSIYRWLLNTRSIVQFLTLVLPLPTRLPFVNEPIVFNI